MGSVTAMNQIPRTDEATDVLSQQLDRIAEANDECGELAPAGKAAIIAARRIVAIGRKAVLRYRTTIAQQDKSITDMASQVAAATTANMPFATAMDRKRQVDAERNKARAKALQGIADDVLAVVGDDAAKAVQGLVKALADWQTAIDRFEFKATAPYSRRIGNDVAKLNAYAMFSDEIRAMVEGGELEALAKRYISAVEHDPEEAAMIESAARPWLTRMIAVGATTLVREQRGLLHGRTSSINDLLAIAHSLLAAFRKQTVKRLPPEIDLSKALLDKVFDLFKLTCGIDASLNGNVPDVEFRRRYLTGAVKAPGKLDTAAGWPLRYKDGGTPALAPWDVSLGTRS